MSVVRIQGGWMDRDCNEPGCPNKCFYKGAGKPPMKCPDHLQTRNKTTLDALDTTDLMSSVEDGDDTTTEKWNNPRSEIYRKAENAKRVGAPRLLAVASRLHKDPISAAAAAGVLETGEALEELWAEAQKPEYQPLREGTLAQAGASLSTTVLLLVEGLLTNAHMIQPHQVGNLVKSIAQSSDLFGGFNRTYSDFAVVFEEDPRQHILAERERCQEIIALAGLDKAMTDRLVALLSENDI